MTNSATRGSLHSIFEPRSVAVIGASQQPGKVGAVTLANLIAGEFSGPIYPVNPHSDSVQGLRAYRNVGELPRPVDLAVLATPAATIPGLVRQCGQAQIGGLIILTAGFRELGAAGRALQDAVRDEAKAFPAMRILGPNCLGALVPGVRLNASFSATSAAPGRVAFVSQSGALCTAVLDWAQAEKLGFSHFVSLGNMLDVDFADMLDYLAASPATDAVILYIESIENARAFMSAARACSRTKPIVAYKAGRFAESAQAAASHTGAMAGVDSVYEAAFERAGIVRVYDIKDLFDCAELLARGPRITGNRLAIVTNAGGPGVMACDALLAQRGKLAQLSPDTHGALNNMLPPSWSHGNPVDVLGDSTPERFASALEIVLADPGVDAALAILTPQAMTQPTETAERVAVVATHAAKPVLTSWMGAHSVSGGVQAFNAAGVPTFDTPLAAITGFMHLLRYGRNRELLYETPREVPLDLPHDRRQLREQLRGLFTAERDWLTESEAKSLLKAYGIPVTEAKLARSADEAARLGREMGFPVVLKIVSPQITHKTDVGGVELNLSDEAQVREAYFRMIDRVRLRQPQATIEGVSVQPMIAQPGGVELILGAKKDPVFGPVIMVGLGGIAAEVFQDRALGLPPLNQTLALRMLESLRAWPLLHGFRGRPPAADVDRLVEILLRFSYLVADFPEIKEFDANPLLVRGDEAVALDARAVIDRQAVAAAGALPYAHLAIRPYPYELVETAQLPNGLSLTLRPIAPEDEPMWRQLLSDCSHDSLWSRFRFMFKADTHESAIRFCFVDHDRELTVVAEAMIDGQRRLLAVARVVNQYDEGIAEFAVLVADRWQGQGLGRLLMQYCLKHVDRARVHTIYGDTLRENTRMINIFKQFGFALTAAEDPALLRAVKTLQPGASPAGN